MFLLRLLRKSESYHLKSSQTIVVECKTNVWYTVGMLNGEGKEMKRTLIELAMLIGLPVMAYFGFVQGVDGALYLVKFSVWAIFLPVGLVGLTTEMQQHLAKTPENGPLRKFASGAVDLSVLVAMIWTGHVATATAFCFYMLCATAAREGAKKYRSEAEQSNRAAAEPSGAGA